MLLAVPAVVERWVEEVELAVERFAAERFSLPEEVLLELVVPVVVRRV